MTTWTDHLSIYGGIFGKGHLVGVDPVFVESSSEYIWEMFGPPGGEGSEASRDLDVTEVSDELDGGHSLMVMGSIMSLDDFISSCFS